MNANRLINMAIRMIMRRGINAGINHVAKRGTSSKNRSAADAEQAQAAQNTTKNARRMMRMTRRMGRF